MAKRGRKPKRRIVWESHKSTLISGIALILILLAVLSAISIFAGVGDSAGLLNSKLRHVLVDGFGFVSPLIPIILVYSGLLIIGTINWKVLNYRIFIGITLLFIGVLGMFGNNGAGYVGGFVLDKTAVLISYPGAVFFYFVLSLFSIVLISNTGLDVYIEKIRAAFAFVVEKVFKINIGSDEPGVAEVDNEGESDNQTALLSGGDVGDTFESPVLDYNGSDFSTPEVELKDFELLAPPSGPVDDLNGVGVDVEGGISADVSSSLPEVTVDVDTSDFDTDKKVSRLPFSNKIWEYPPHSLLSEIPNRPPDAGDIEGRAKMIEETLRAFGINATTVDKHVGPAVTRYALNLPIGIKASKVQGLSTDLALRLKSPSGSVRIEAPIPGTNLVGIEVPNFTPSSVSLRSVLESDELKKSRPKLSVAIGHDVSGKSVVQDISKWPHALIAGATGTGKSVLLNEIIATLLFRCSPSECRFIMIDPKLVELSQYNGIPHLLTPVVTDIEQKAVSALAWAVAEMERRYKLFANARVRNLADFNTKSGFQAEPYIVIVVDEIADMMMVAASEVEKYIIRLAQKSRATGIHLILATQRPSVNILTGTIKANIPTRFAFKVTSNVDSRVIIDQSGAETLIGRGDMLFVPPDDSKPRRLQGAYVSDDEITRLVDYLRNTGIEPDYKDEILRHKVEAKAGSGKASGEVDPKVAEALEVILSEGKASASYLQRKLGLGYSRAARIVDELEDVGIIGQARGSKPRDVLVANMDEAMTRLSAGSEESE
ncbi:MAG: DNA translocase FtsK [bacterium]|nr:DNA translocase FtsK [bacterium]